MYPKARGLRNYYATLNRTCVSALTPNIFFTSLLDERFIEGIYRGSFRHDPDLDAVVVRAAATGVRRIILTAGTIDESRVAVQKAREWNARYKEQQQQQQQRLDVLFSCTVGVHPTRCSQVFAATANVDAEAGDSANADDNAIDKTTTTSDSDTRLLNELLEICKDGMKDGTVVAVGEIGLDYDRLEFCPADIQQKYLILQLQTLAAQTGLPLFLHNRSVGDDLYRILVEYGDCWRNNGGVVHSFDDSMELASKFTQDLGLYIGINGCSLRTNENLETVEQLPLEHILLETEYVSIKCFFCFIRICPHV